MDGGAWWAAVHGVVKSGTRLSDFTFTFHFHALEKEMAAHSSVLAWRIPGTGEPGGLPSMGSHRVGHDWSNLAAAAAASERWDISLIYKVDANVVGKNNFCYFHEKNQESIVGDFSEHSAMLWTYFSRLVNIFNLIIKKEHNEFGKYSITILTLMLEITFLYEEFFLMKIRKLYNF